MNSNKQVKKDKRDRPRITWNSIVAELLKRKLKIWEDAKDKLDTYRNIVFQLKCTVKLYEI